MNFQLSRKNALFVAGIFAFLGFLFTFLAIPKSSTESVVVLARDVEAYTVLKDEDVKVKQMPADAIPADAIRKKEDAVGKAIFSSLLMDDVLRAGHLKELEKARVSGVLKPDEVAVALPRELETAVGETVQPGDRVDVYFSTKDTSELIFSRAEVLGVKNLISEEGKDQPQRALVLKVKSHEIPKYLAALSSGGKIVTVILPYEGDFSLPPSTIPQAEEQDRTEGDTK
ncbi:MAG: Flp pilus assembly protein CpaB [Brockia lithotrophica]|nr:Flp pilus assembly protein CpaB [Brockia lithotrophica]